MNWDEVLEDIQIGKDLTPEQLQQRVEFLEGMLDIKDNEIEVLKSYVDWDNIRATNKTWREKFNGYEGM